jgi:hypothetical protein
MRNILIGAAMAAIALGGAAEARGSKSGSSGHSLARSHARGAGLRTESTNERLARREDAVDRIKVGHASKPRRAHSERSSTRDAETTGMAADTAAPADQAPAIQAPVRRATAAPVAEAAPAAIAAGGAADGATAQCRDGS